MLIGTTTSSGKSELRKAILHSSIAAHSPIQPNRLLWNINGNRTFQGTTHE